jgi:alpha-glucosidase
MKKTAFLLILFLRLQGVISAQEAYKIQSPNKKITVTVQNLHGNLSYSIQYGSTTVLNPSKLGVVREDDDFSQNLATTSFTAASKISDNYTMLQGKRRQCKYEANEASLHLKSAKGNPMDVIFRVSNDGAAFRYYFPQPSKELKKIKYETSSFHFPTTATAFIQHCANSRTGWNSSEPSYEKLYEQAIPVGTPAPFEAGWVMPALFHSGEIWVAITEAAVEGNYCGSRLSQQSPDGEYSIQFPQANENFTGEATYPQSTLPWYSPWRILTIGDKLATIVESTLGTDLATPAQYDIEKWATFGKSSWSWLLLGDESVNYETSKQFIDFAANMHWQYCLIDALWDSAIGYDKIKELVDYAKAKNVKTLVWYNSAGDWNTVPHTPRGKLLTKEMRAAEFQKLKEMGVAGIKIDFMNGDGQSMIKFQDDILKEAAQYQLTVNFHGCTYPRGRQRTYPNLVTTEAIMGEENVMFNKDYPSNQPTHCATIPFTRNLFDPMDFTPVNFTKVEKGVKINTKGFELALSVLFLSGIQHYGETPQEMASQQDFVQEYFRTIPDAWDNVKFIDGYPGKYVIIARKSGNKWYIAGINATKKELEVNLNLAFVKGSQNATIINDGEKDLQQSPIQLSEKTNLKIKPLGGFVIVN